MADTCELCGEVQPHCCDREGASGNEFVHHGLRRLTMALESANKLKALELLNTCGIDPDLVKKALEN
jgi:hypothetical protein